VWGRPHRALTLGIVTVVLLIDFEATAIGTAMPIAGQGVGRLALYAFAFSAFFKTSLFAMVVSGQWCDSNGPLPAGGRHRRLRGGPGHIRHAQSMWPFVLGRAVQGSAAASSSWPWYVVWARLPRAAAADDNPCASA